VSFTRLQVFAMAMGWPLLLSAPVLAQQAPRPEGGGTLEIKQGEIPSSKDRRPIVYPAPQSKEEISEAERQVEDLEAKQPPERLLDETKPSTLQRPDLGYDVTTGIQEKAIQNALPR